MANTSKLYWICESDMKKHLLVMGTTWIVIVKIATLVACIYVVYDIFQNRDTTALPWLIPVFWAAICVAGVIIAIPGFLMAGIGGGLLLRDHNRLRKAEAYLATQPTLQEIMDKAAASSSKTIENSIEQPVATIRD